MFSVLKLVEHSSKVNIISCKRYIQITGLLTLGDKKEYVNKTVFVKSTKKEMKEGKPSKRYHKVIYR